MAHLSFFFNFFWQDNMLVVLGQVPKINRNIQLNGKYVPYGWDASEAELEDFPSLCSKHKPMIGRQNSALSRQWLLWIRQLRRHLRKLSRSFQLSTGRGVLAGLWRGRRLRLQRSRNKRSILSVLFIILREIFLYLSQKMSVIFWVANHLFRWRPDYASAKTQNSKFRLLRLVRKWFGVKGRSSHGSTPSLVNGLNLASEVAAARADHRELYPTVARLVIFPGLTSLLRAYQVKSGREVEMPRNFFPVNLDEDLGVQKGRRAQVAAYHQEMTYTQLVSVLLRTDTMNGHPVKSSMLEKRGR